MKQLYLTFIFASAVALANAQTCVGPVPGTAAANQAVTGSTTTWGTVTNAFASDNNYAITGSLPTNANYTDRLVVTGFGFSLPNTAVITGIEVRVEKSVTGSSNIADREIMLVKAGVTQTVHNKAVTGTAWPTADAVFTYGSSLDLWGNSWTYTDINDPNFGVAIAAQRFSASGPPQQARVDQVTVTVCYSLLAPLHITRFRGRLNSNNEAVLNWQAQNENDVSGYHVERSFNGVNFTSIAFVPAKNNTENNYTWQTPCTGKAFYRIQQTGRDGSSFYTGVVNIDCGSRGLSITSRNKTITIANLQPGPGSLFIYSADGRLVASKNWQQQAPNGLFEFTLPATLLNNSGATGIYRVQVVNGTQKLVKTIAPGL